jgi:hypothetical protein
MTTIGAGIGNDTHLYRGQRPIAFGAQLDTGRHRMLGGCADELLFAGELPHDGPSGFHRSKDTQILGKHLLFAAKPADPLGEDVKVARKQPKDSENCRRMKEIRASFMPRT